MTYNANKDRYQFVQRPVPGASTVTVTSSLGGSDTRPVVQD